MTGVQTCALPIFAAGALGISEADLRTALQAGKSIAQVAAEKNIPVQNRQDFTWRRYVWSIGCECYL